MADLSQRQDLAWLAEVVGDLAQGAVDIRPLLVGALARDLWLHYLHGHRIDRATTDVDFAVAVSDWDDFAQLRQRLLAHGAFVAHPRVDHKIRHRRHGWVDLVPFGAIEGADGTIAWPPAGDHVMAVLGYAEAAANATVVTLPEGQSAHLVSLPMLTVLKVFAWGDRHHATNGKDAADLGLILRSYLDCGHLERFSTEFPERLGDGFDVDAASASLAGRDARAALRRCSTRYDLTIDGLRRILDAALAPSRRSEWVGTFDRVNPGRGLSMLSAYRAGLLDLSDS